VGQGVRQLTSDPAGVVLERFERLTDLVEQTQHDDVILAVMMLEKTGERSAGVEPIKK
jgi:hypothetical protein